MSEYFCVAAALLVIATSAVEVRGNGYQFELTEHGTIDIDRPLPDVKIVQASGKPIKTGIHRQAVFMNFGGDCRIQLGEIVGWDHPELKREVSSGGNPLRTKVDVDHPALKEEVSSGVVIDSVQIGWLAGAHDLLMIAWTDDHGRFGTSHSVYLGTIIARYNGMEVAPLIRVRSLISGSARHIHFPGLENRHYTFDAETDVLEETINQHVMLISESPQPLHVTSGVSDAHGFAFYANIQQQCIKRLRYKDGKLVQLSIQFSYQAQGRESLRDIAKFHLGPFASAQALLKVNPELQDQANTGIVPAKGTQIQIPIPEDWLSRFYSSADPSH